MKFFGKHSVLVSQSNRLWYKKVVCVSPNVITRIFVSCQGNFSGVPIRTEKGKNEHFFKTFLLTRVCEWLRNRLENHRILIAAYGIIGQGGNSGTSDKAHRYTF